MDQKHNNTSQQYSFVLQKVRRLTTIIFFLSVVYTSYSVTDTRVHRTK